MNGRHTSAWYEVELTLALRQKSVPEVAATGDCSKQPVAVLAVVEAEADVARGVGDELTSVDVVDRPAVLQLLQVRTPGTYSCIYRPPTSMIEFHT